MEYRDPYLDEEDDIKIMDSRDENWRDADEDDDERGKINAMRWDVYMKEKGESINRKFLVMVNQPKVGNIIWSFFKNNIIYEKD